MHRKMPSVKSSLHVLAVTLVFAPTIFAGSLSKRNRPLALEDTDYDGTIYSVCFPGEEMCMKAHSWDPEEIWECVDTQKSIKNCGGCTQPMQDAQPFGRDCTIIPGQKSVFCVKGACIISKCHAGWQLSRDKMACYELYDEGD